MNPTLLSATLIQRKILISTYPPISNKDLPEYSITGVVQGVCIEKGQIFDLTSIFAGSDRTSLLGRDKGPVQHNQSRRAGFGVSTSKGCQRNSLISSTLRFTTGKKEGIKTIARFVLLSLWRANRSMSCPADMFFTGIAWFLGWSSGLPVLHARPAC